MAVGFTTKERESITEALLRAAGRHAALSGMKKTSVDELCAEAGISKGALLFLLSQQRASLSDSDGALAGGNLPPGRGCLRQAGELNGPQRAALMMKTACRAMRKKSMERFLREDIPLILRKLPQEDLRNHTLTEEAFVHGILPENGGAALHCRKCGICHDLHAIPYPAVRGAHRPGLR